MAQTAATSYLLEGVARERMTEATISILEALAARFGSLPIPPEVQQPRVLKQSRDLLFFLVHRRLGMIPKTLADCIATTYDTYLLNQCSRQAVLLAQVDESTFLQILK